MRLPPSRDLNSLGQDLLYQAIKQVLGSAITEQLVNLTVEGLENIPARGPVLLVPNHRTMTDPFLLGAVVPRRIHFVVAGFLSRFPISERIISGTGNILLPVSKGGRSKELIDKARRLLMQGRLVGVFPEGVDNFVNGSPPGTIAPFHSSFARLIVQMKVPGLVVVPVAITGDEEQVILRFPSRFMRALDPGNRAWTEGDVQGTIYRKARIRVGAPLSFENFYDLPPERQDEGVKRIVEVTRSAVVQLAGPPPARRRQPRQTMTGPLFDENDA